MPDRLSIINDALVNTSNNRVQVEFEDSDEWLVAKTGYDRFLPQLLEAHPWNFATTSQALVKLPDADNPSVRFSAELDGFAHSMPANCLWLEAVYRNGIPVDFEIVDDKICCGFDADEVDLIAKYVRIPPVDNVSNLFWEALRKFVEAACMRGLNDENGDRREQEGWAMLQKAANRSDQQQPRRSPRVSRMLARRKGLV